MIRTGLPRGAKVWTLGPSGKVLPGKLLDDSRDREAFLVDMAGDVGPLYREECWITEAEAWEEYARRCRDRIGLAERDLKAAQDRIEALKAAYAEEKRR